MESTGFAVTLRMMGRSLAHFFFPNVCINCSQELQQGQRLVCLACWDGIPVIEQTECPFCWVRNDKPACTCLEFKETRLNSILSGWLYRGAARDIVHEIKYGRKQKLGMDAGARLAKKIAGNMPLVDVVMAVPSHHSRVRERGYNQAHVIAQGFCKEAGLPLRADLLRRIKWTSSQTTKDRATRAKNIKGNFMVPRKARIAIQGANILLVDDVFTTGATLSECAGVLLDSGAARVSAATLVRVPELREGRDTDPELT